MYKKKPVYLKTDLNYLVVTNNLYMMQDVKHLKEKSAKGRFAFTLEDDPDFADVLIQVTPKGYVNIYLPRGAPEEEIREKILDVLSKANQAPLTVLAEKSGDNGMGRETAAEYKTALEHSKKLIPGLECLLLEDKVGWLSECPESAWTWKIETEGVELKPFAEQHLRSAPCYSTTYRKLSQHRKLRGRIRKRLEKAQIPQCVIDLALEAIEDVGRRCSEKEARLIQQVQEELIASYAKFASDIRLLEKRILHGNPLSGKCSLCLEDKRQ